MVHVLLFTALVSASAAADPPLGYYDSVDTSSQSALRATLHAVIDDHTKISYTSSSIDTWDVLELAQEDPSDSGRLIDIYRNASYPKLTTGNTLYQREHSWPKSYGFPDDGSDNMPYSDCHLLFLCNGTYNQNRSNKPFGSCGSSCAELVTEFNDGQGGGSGVFPGNSNWTTSGLFQVSSFRKGDIARAMLYADVRYEGGTHTFTGIMEPDLILTDNLGLIAGSSTGQNETFGYMGRLAVLLDWHLADPVDDFERNRNDVVGSFQGNRNPFVDHPEWVDCLFLGNCVPGGSYCGPAVLNSTGLPAVLEGRGSVTLSTNDMRLVVSQMPANSFGFFIASRTEDFVVQAGGSTGNLCLGGDVGRGVGGQILNSGLFGSFATSVDALALPQPTGPEAATIGETWHFQAWYRDAIGGQVTSNFTDGWRVTWQ